MDADRFDTLARALHSSPTRRLTLGALTALGLAALLGDDEIAAKKKGAKKKGAKKKGGKKKGVKCQGKSCKKKEKEFCVSLGGGCRVTVHPCCKGTLCCEDGKGFLVCLPKDQCCKSDGHLDNYCTTSDVCCGSQCCFEGKCQSNGGTGTECSGEDSTYCCEGYTCVKPDGIFGTCQPG